MFVARCRPRVLQCPRRREEVSPSSLLATANNRRGVPRRPWRHRTIFPSGTVARFVAVRSRRSPFLRSPKDNSQEDSMKARRFVSRGTVALVSFLLVASLAHSASRVASARRQAEQKDVQQKPDAQGIQQKTDKQKAEP